MVLKNWLRWQPGRQAAEYRKMLLAEIPGLQLDAWLLEYEEGTELYWHTDRIPGHEHWRMNIVLKTGGGRLQHMKTFPADPEVGERIGDGVLVKIGERLRIFRSDVSHRVTQLTDGRRIVLSIGWARPCSA